MPLWFFLKGLGVPDPVWHLLPPMPATGSALKQSGHAAKVSRSQGVMQPRYQPTKVSTSIIINSHPRVKKTHKDKQNNRQDCCPLCYCGTRRHALTAHSEQGIACSPPHNYAKRPEKKLSFSLTCGISSTGSENSKQPCRQR